MTTFEVVFYEDGGVPYVAVGIKRLAFSFCFEFLVVAKDLRMSLIYSCKVFPIAL